MTTRCDNGYELQKVAQSIYECLRCAFCFDLSWLGSANLCPAYAWGVFESYGARGRIAIARALLEGELSYDEMVMQRVFACTECRSCTEHCFKYIDTVKIFSAMRRELAMRGLVPQKLMASLASLIQMHNLYGKPHEQRLSWLKDRSRVDRQAPVALFVGCTPAYVRRSLAQNAYNFLAASGVDFTVLSDEWCCGHPFLAAGLVDHAAELMHHNIHALQALGIKRVVFDCPGCMWTFREAIPQMLHEPLPFEVVHLTEEMANQVQVGRLRFDVYQSNTVVTYHDPCTLGRGLGIYEAPRTVIAAMPGMHLREMPRHGRDAYCCGAGSFVRYDYPDFADKTGIDRFREVEASGASIVLTSCPACVTQFQALRGQLGSQVQVMDLASLVVSIACWK